MIPDARQRQMPLLMGILNVTPDSFSDGGRWFEPAAAIARGLELLDQGADWLDIGGESTRPGADPVPAEVEIERVVPVVTELARLRPDALLSIDTVKPVVARAAVEAGARLVNDVSGLADPELLDVCAETGAGIALMHTRGTPRTMQQFTDYDDLVEEVARALDALAARARAAGVSPSRILIDPGLGFAKKPADNPRLIASIPRFSALGYPVLVGASRKRFIGELTGIADPTQRVFGSIGAALAAASAGASVLRVHDVAATRQALTLYGACRRGD